MGWGEGKWVWGFGQGNRIWIFWRRERLAPASPQRGEDARRADEGVREAQNGVPESPLIRRGAPPSRRWGEERDPALPLKFQMRLPWGFGWCELVCVDFHIFGLATIKTHLSFHAGVSVPWFDHARLPIPPLWQRISAGARMRATLSLTSLRWSEGSSPCPVRWFFPRNSGPSASGSLGLAGSKTLPASGQVRSEVFRLEPPGSPIPICPRTSNATQARHGLFQPEEDHFLHGPDDGDMRRLPATGTGPASTHRHAL